MEYPAFRPTLTVQQELDIKSGHLDIPEDELKVRVRVRMF